jgi:hypothetical protein
MPDLDWLAEVGPRFQYTVARAARDAKIDFELPARAVLLSDFTNLHFRGFIAAPRLSYQNENFFAQDLELKLSLGGNWASTRLADYFYQVKASRVTPSRPLYKANGGYMGSSLNLTFSLPLIRKIKLIVLGVANFHHGASNKNSPLFRDKTTLGIGAALRWAFYQSRRRAFF